MVKETQGHLEFNEINESRAEKEKEKKKEDKAKKENSLGKHDETEVWHSSLSEKSSCCLTLKKDVTSQQRDNVRSTDIEDDDGNMHLAKRTKTN